VCVCVCACVCVHMTWLIPICDITQVLHRARASVAVLCFICVAWLVRMRDMTDFYVWHDSSMCVTWLIPMCHMTQLLHRAQGSVAVFFRMCSTTHTHVCNVTHPYVWHDSGAASRTSKRRPLLFHTCGMIHAYAWYDWIIFVPWLICICDMTQAYMWHDSGAASCARKRCRPFSYVWHDAYACVTGLMWHDSSIYLTYDMTQVLHYARASVALFCFICVLWLIRMCVMTDVYVWRDSSIYVTWLRCCVARA